MLIPSVGDGLPLDDLRAILEVDRFPDSRPLW